MKTIVLTGGTGGIGRESAIKLAAEGHTLLVTGRDRARGEQSVTEIRKQSGNQNVALYIADMASLAAVRGLARELSSSLEKIDVLINNAGVLTSVDARTEDGFEPHLAVNHLAPMLLTNELLPLLEAAGHARVINLTGGMPRSVDLSNIDNRRDASAMVRYSHSKAIMMAATYELAMRLDPTRIAVHVVYPGGANTAMTQNMSKDMLPGAMKLFAGLMKRVMRNASPVRATRSTVHAATAEEIEGMTALYLHPSAKRASWPKSVVEPLVLSEVWKATEAWLGLALPSDLVASAPR